MAYNFRHNNRSQLFLFAPDIREWIPEDHLVWTVIDVVGQIDISAFLARYNALGVGAAAYHPKTLLALVFYAWCVGVRSSRKIARHCVESVPFRIAAGGQCPDHRTICRFITENAEALSSCFGRVLLLCGMAGMVELGKIAIDGTKIGANASMAANRDLPHIEKELAKIGEKLINETKTVDESEDQAEVFASAPDKGANRSDNDKREHRARKLRECRQRLEEMEAATREAQRQKIADREKEEAETGQKKRGRKPKEPEALGCTPKVNTTDPDSRIMKSQKGFMQGYNAQIATSEDQIIVAAHITTEANDKKQLIPMLEETSASLEMLFQADPSIIEEQTVGHILVDAGYVSEAALNEAETFLETSDSLQNGELLACTTSERKSRTKTNGESANAPLPDKSHLPHTAAMTRRLSTPEGKEAYKKRGSIVEPVFGQIKESLQFRGFLRRGIDLCSMEWLLICTAHNITKLGRYLLRQGKRLGEQVVVGLGAKKMAEMAA